MYYGYFAAVSGVFGAGGPNFALFYVAPEGFAGLFRGWHENFFATDSSDIH